MKIVAATISQAEMAALRLATEGVNVNGWEVRVSPFCPPDTVFVLNEAAERSRAAPSGEPTERL